MQMSEIQGCLTMEKNDKFNIKNFISPDVSYAPVYVWVWNDVCTRDIIDAQLKEMQNLGIRAFYILPEPKNFRPDSMPTKLTPDYLSDEYFELCAYAIKKGKSFGMSCWLYDEGGWPSGGACGKVLKDHPEYARQVLEVYDTSFLKGDVYKKTTSDVIAAFFNDKEIIEEGYIFSEDTVVNEYIIEKQISGDADYPDLLNEKATKYFIEITHERYAASLKSAFGNYVSAIFTDEPKAPLKPFNKELAEKYEQLYGESILPYLPLIAKRIKPTEENVYILYRWYDLCSRMFCDNFLLSCKKWANENGIAFTGHMDMDHSPLGCVCGGGNFNLMRALRCFDVPGVDIIWRQLYPENKVSDKNDMNAYNGFFPRYASSAAAQNGTKYALSEIFGVAGAAVTYDIMRYTVGYQAVRGINIFNPFNFPLGRKESLLAQELPVFTENQPYYKHLDRFNRYVERLSYISSVGERVCRTGLYYPINDFQGGLKAEAMAEKFESMGRALEDMMVDFDIVDDDVIQGANGAENGRLYIGNATYEHIIIPKEAFVPEESRVVLERFINGGGKVSETLSDLEEVIHIEGEGLRAMHRRAENSELYILFREKGESEKYKIYLPSSKGYLLDLMTGELQRFEAKDSTLELSINIGETVVILLTEENLNSVNQKEMKNEYDIAENFVFRKELELVCRENGFEIIEHSEKSASINQGDWKNSVGESYSGSGVYETTFTLPEEKIGKEGEIDLGDVHFSAEVFLNDKYLGVALMYPYRFKIPEGVLDKENKLKIIVTNTSANWYTCTDYFDKWRTEELSQYFETELNYAKDFESGGLYGPVKLYTE